MKLCKKLGIVLITNLMALLALILNILQFFLNFIMNAGTVMTGIIQIGCWFMGVMVGVIPIFTMEGSFLKKLLDAALGMGITVLFGRLLCWLITKLSWLLEQALGWIHLDRIADRFQDWLPRLFTAYIKLNGDDPLSPVDRYLLFGLFVVLDKLLTGALRTLYALRKWLPWVFGISGAVVLTYELLKDGIAAWGVSEYLSAAVFLGAAITALLAIAKFFAAWLETVQADSSIGLDDTFRAYSKFFRNDESTQDEKETSQSDTPKSHIYYNDDSNPYVAMLIQAGSMEAMRKKYRKLALEVHPDVAGVQSTERQQMLNDAYEKAKKYFG